MARSMTTGLVFRVLAITVIASFAADRVSAPQTVIVLRQTKAIPKDFKTWSLFLVCNPKSLL
jgi:hypothetical protein